MTRIHPAAFTTRTIAVTGAIGAAFAVLAAMQDPALAQERRILSPPGHAAVQVGGTFDPVQYGYLGGRWIDVYYGRPSSAGATSSGRRIGRRC